MPKAQGLRQLNDPVLREAAYDVLTKLLVERPQITQIAAAGDEDRAGRHAGPQVIGGEGLGVADVVDGNVGCAQQYPLT